MKHLLIIIGIIFLTAQCPDCPTHNPTICDTTIIKDTIVYDTIEIPFTVYDTVLVPKDTLIIHWKDSINWKIPPYNSAFNVDTWGNVFYNNGLDTIWLPVQNQTEFDYFYNATEMIHFRIEIEDSIPEVIKTGNYYISPVGNETNDGKTPETAWPVSKINDIPSGDTVIFLSGIYTENLNITQSNITIISDNAILSGLKQLSEFSQNGNILSININSPYEILQGETRLKPSRWPDFGWSFPDVVGSNYFTDNELNFTFSQGAICHIKTALYRLYHPTISSVNSRTVTLSESVPSSVSYGYFVTKLVSEINEPGEWAYSNGKLYVWPLNSDPIYSIDRNIAINISGNNITFQGFRVIGASQYGIEISGDGVKLIDNIISYCNVSIHGESDNIVILNNQIFYPGSQGINISNSYKPIIQNNYVYASGTDEKDGDVLYGRGDGIQISNTPYAQILNNQIIKCGRTGIFLSGNSGRGRMIKDNHIWGTMLASADGGAIYNNAANSGLSQWDTIQGNIISYVPGSLVGTKSSNAATVGIYIDEPSSTTNGYAQEKWLIKNNSVDSVDRGIYLHDARNCIIDGNMINYCKYDLNFNDVVQSPDYRMTGLQILRNKFTSPNSYLINYDISDYGSFIPPEVSDYNQYTTPSNNIIRVYSGSSTYYTLQSWRSSFNLDINSIKK